MPSRAASESSQKVTETVPMRLDEALAVWIYLRGSTWYGPTEQEAGKRAQETIRIYALEAIKRMAGGAMTTPTQAQIEAAAEQEWQRGYEAGMKSAAPAIEVLKKDNDATIERCAQVVKEYIEGLTDPKSETMSHWDQIRGQVETFKGSDLPRLNFEGLIETIAENAAATISALKEAPRCEWPTCGCPEGSRCPGR